LGECNATAVGIANYKIIVSSAGNAVISVATFVLTKAHGIYTHMYISAASVLRHIALSILYHTPLHQKSAFQIISLH
jgi:hypothetical protein